MSTVDDVLSVLENKKKEKKKVIAQIAPAVRVTIGELFGCEPGTIVTKKLVGALKEAGFDLVFDTSVAADVVTVEEGTEFIDRLENNEDLPLFTSCCPASVSFIEQNFPQHLDHFCTVKSPQQTMGALIKSYYSRKTGIKAKDMHVVSIMPCFVKKLEAKRPEMEFNGLPHVDSVLTTVEIAQLLKAKGIDLNKAKEKDFDKFLGSASGAGQLFGETGGVSEALLRFVSSRLGEWPTKVEFSAIRGNKGFREALIDINGKKIRVAVIHGLANLKDLISNEKKFNSYQVIEIMVCPYGCIGGGGQPPSTDKEREARRKALLRVDANEKVRVSSENPEIKKMYETYLMEPGSRTATSILHTSRVCLKCK